MLVKHLHKKTTPSVCFRDEKRKSYLTNTSHVTWWWLDRWSKPLQHSSKELPSQSPEICPCFIAGGAMRHHLHLQHTRDPQMQKATACHWSAIETLSNVGQEGGISCMDRYCFIASGSISVCKETWKPQPGDTTSLQGTFSQSL